jgi:outer membrane protein OmpA-like peptidoglycan-associated protein
MATSTLSSLFNLLDSRSVNDIASRLGESGQTVSRGLESTTATLINGLSNKSSDTGIMSQIFRLISQTPSDVNLSSLTSAVTGTTPAAGATASLLDASKKLLGFVFGNDQSSVVDAIGRACGLRMSSVASLLSIATPLVMSALGRTVRSGQMTQSQFGDLLASENAAAQSMLPAGLQRQVDRTIPRTETTDTGYRPLSIRTYKEERPRSLGWLWLLPALLLIPLFFWLFNRQHVRQVGETLRPTTNLGNFVPRRLPDNVQLNIPSNGMEMRLLNYIQDPNVDVNRVTWFDFDRLLFNTDSATLRPESQEQLRNIAAILKAYPNVNVKVGGYTDNTGDPQHNLALSQDRADGVVAQLVALGIAPNRLEAQGYGSQFPVADNATAEGRAMNRRISMRVTQK